MCDLFIVIFCYDDNVNSSKKGWLWLIFVLIFSFLVKHETARPHISYHALIAGIMKLALLIFCQNSIQRRSKIAQTILYPTHGHLPQEMIPRVADNIDRVRIQVIEVSKL